MSSGDLQPPLNAYGEAWGPPLIATYIAAIVYGISVLQTFYYYSHHGARDGWGWLTLVAVIFALDSAAMGLFMYCVYYYSILSWGMPEMLDPDVKEFPAEYILTTFLALIVQCFYINTIRALHAPIIITILLGMAAFVAFVTGLILPAVQLELVSIQTIVVAPLNHLAFNIARGSALACDLGIVAVLCWLFSSRKTGIRRANNMLDALIMFSVQRGVLQAIVQTGEVLAYAIKPDGLYFLPFHVIVSRIYCNSLLATLNSRDYVFSKRLSKRTRRREIRGDNQILEMGNIPGNHPKQEQQDGCIENVAQGAKRGDNQVVPSGLSAPKEAITTSRWASTVSGTRQILSSFLEPPFLYTDESFALASRGIRSPTRHSNSVSMIHSISASDMPTSAMNSTADTNLDMDTSRFADSETSTQDLTKARTLAGGPMNIDIECGASSQASLSPITPVSKDRDAAEEYKAPSI